MIKATINYTYTVQTWALSPWKETTLTAVWPSMCALLNDAKGLYALGNKVSIRFNSGNREYSVAFIGYKIEVAVITANTIEVLGWFKTIDELGEYLPQTCSCPSDIGLFCPMTCEG